MSNEVLATNEDDTIIYKHLTSKYLQETCNVTRQTLFKSGNVCRVIGVPNDLEALAELDQITLSSAKDGVSVIAIDKKTDKVVGIAINKFLIKSQPFFEQFRASFKNFKSRQVVEFVISMDNSCDIFKHCNVTNVMEILFLGTLPEYRKKGIAKKLCEISVEIAEKLRDGINVKCPVDDEELGLEPVPETVYAIFTSFISQKIGKDLGFEIAAERTVRKMELLGQVVDNAEVETPVTTAQFKMLTSSRKN